MRTFIIGGLACLCCLAANAADRTLLLVDDHHVLYRAGTERVLHQPERHAENPVVKEDKPWEEAIAWTNVYRDPETGQYQLWYQAYVDKAIAKVPQCTTSYAVSDDGIHWTKPKLDFHPYGDVAKTNIVMVGNDGRSYRYCNAVVVDPRDPDPARRYKMAYFDFSVRDGQEYPGMHVAFSPDGIKWTVPDVPMPVTTTNYGHVNEQPAFRGEPGKHWAVPLSIADAQDVFYDAKRGVFANYAKMWIDGPEGGIAWKHAMGRSESKDFIHWSTPELVLTPDDNDPPHLEFHTTPVFLYADCYFSLNQVLDRSTLGGVIDIELMLSRDGLKWERPFRNTPFMARKDGKRFESGSIFTNSTPIILEDEIRFYYGAYSHGATSWANGEQNSGIGLATLPRDRFAGIRPVAESKYGLNREPVHNIGQVTLKPVELSSDTTITLNADASAGSIRVELLDAGGYRVEGYTKDDGVPITGDSLRHAVGWKNGTVPDGRFMLRIHLDNAEVFAVNLAAEE
jgi:hypothetical protein